MKSIADYQENKTEYDLQGKLQFANFRLQEPSSTKKGF